MYEALLCHWVNPPVKMTIFSRSFQILNMCFELYYLARSGTFVHEDESRMDIFAAVTILLQNASVFFTVSLEAAYVHDEAQRGYEILRLRGQQRYDSWAKRLLVSHRSSINNTLNPAIYFKRLYYWSFQTDSQSLSKLFKPDRHDGRKILCN